MKWSGPVDENHFSVFIPAVCFSFAPLVGWINIVSMYPFIKHLWCGQWCQPWSNPHFQSERQCPWGFSSFMAHQKTSLKSWTNNNNNHKKLLMSSWRLSCELIRHHTREVKHCGGTVVGWWWRSAAGACEGWTVCRKTQSLGVLEGKKTWCMMMSMQPT